MITIAMIAIMVTVAINSRGTVIAVDGELAVVVKLHVLFFKLLS